MELNKQINDEVKFAVAPCGSSEKNCWRLRINGGYDVPEIAMCLQRAYFSTECWPKQELKNDSIIVEENINLKGCFFFDLSKLVYQVVVGTNFFVAFPYFIL